MKRTSVKYMIMPKWVPVLMFSGININYWKQPIAYF